MTIEQTLGDGSTGKWPDGTPDVVIAQDIAEYNAALEPQQPFLPTGEQLPGEIRKGLTAGALEGTSFALGLPADIATGIEAAGARARTEDPQTFEAGGLAGLIGGGGPSVSTGLGELLGRESIRGGITSITGEPDQPVTGLGQTIKTATDVAVSSCTCNSNYLFTSSKFLGPFLF